MDNNTIISIIGGLVILGLIILAVYIRMKKNPSIYDKKAAQEFLEGLSNVFYDKIMEIVNGINFSDFNSIEELEAKVFHDIYDTIWEYVSKELEEASKKDILTALVLKVINKEFVDKFIDNLLENEDIIPKIENGWKTSKIEATSDQILKEEEKVAKEFSDKSQYNEDFNKEDLPKGGDVIDVDEEAAKNLVPAKDVSEDDLKYDTENDDSVEIMDDETFVDSKGRKRDKKTGRYV